MHDEKIVEGVENEGSNATLMNEVSAIEDYPLPENPTIDDILGMAGVTNGTDMDYDPNIFSLEEAIPSEDHDLREQNRGGYNTHGKNNATKPTAAAEELETVTDEPTTSKYETNDSPDSSTEPESIPSSSENDNKPAPEGRRFRGYFGNSYGRSQDDRKRRHHRRQRYHFSD
jgi:hypothetical protein